MAKQDTITAIYGLHAEDGEIRYIGKSVNPKTRLTSHISKAKVNLSNLSRWVNAANSRGALKMVILEWAEDWREAERRWIAKGKESGWRLLNISPGGDDMSHTNSAAAKIRKQSTYNKALRQIVLCELNSRGIVPPEVSERMRGHIVNIRKEYNRIKRKLGQEAADAYGEDLHRRITHVPH